MFLDNFKLFIGILNIQKKKKNYYSNNIDENI